MDFKNLECLYVLIVQYEQAKSRVTSGDTIFLHIVADTFKNLRESIARFKKDLRRLDRIYGRGKFPQYRALERLLTMEDPPWSDCLPILENMAINHPDGDEPVETRISNR